MALPAQPPMSRRKKFLFFCIMQFLSLFFLIICIEGYYLYGYMFFKDDFCGTFANLDDEIGWVLKPSTQSCIKSGESPADPDSFFSEVYMNADGSRTEDITSPTLTNSILAVGDSWTFGYGIDWNETFAGQLTTVNDMPTALFASPAYSGAQALLLARRHINSVKPKTIVYLEFGFWDRAVCSGKTRPTSILKPCYWVDDDAVVHLVTPEPGYVRRMSSFGLRPGGMVGGGEKTLPYFLIARPVAKINQMLVRLGLLSGFGNDYAAWGEEEDFARIRAAHLERLLLLAKGSGARLLLIDPKGLYQADTIGNDLGNHLIYVGSADWQTSVGIPISKLPPSQVWVPGDGHYGPIPHRLIAELIQTTIRRGNQFQQH